MRKLLIIAIALISIQGIAQNDTKERPHRRDMAQRMNNLTPEEAAKLHTKRLALHLDLTKEQQDEIYNLNLEQAKTRKERMEAFKAKRANGEFEKPSKEDRLEMVNNRLDRQIAMKAKMKHILNADQYAKWETSREKMAQRFGDKKPSDGFRRR